VELVGQKLRDIHYSVVMQVEKFKFHLATTEKKLGDGGSDAAVGCSSWETAVDADDLR